MRWVTTDVRTAIASVEGCGDHEGVRLAPNSPCVASRIRECERGEEDIEQAICSGLREQLDDDANVDYVYRCELYGETRGKNLDRAWLEKARREEIKIYKEIKVYAKVPDSRAVEATGKNPIGVNWVGVLQTSGKHSTRLVAKEFNNGGDPDMNAPTPADHGGGRRTCAARKWVEETAKIRGFHAHACRCPP